MFCLREHIYGKTLSQTGASMLLFAIHTMGTAAALAPDSAVAVAAAT